MLRVIKEVQPRWVVGENVSGLVGWNDGLVFHEVYDDLEREGYEVQSFLIPAAAVNASHERKRVFFIAHSQRNGLEHRNETRDISQEEGKTRRQRSELTDEFTSNGSQFNTYGKIDIEVKRLICGGVNGFSEKLDTISFPKWRKESIKAYGNAVVPQVIHTLFKSIQDVDDKIYR
jgi:DNA (cytosine-5)-methyltransferase 1